MRVTICGKRWDYREVTNLGKDSHGCRCLGRCSPPDEPNRYIRVLKGLDDKERLEVRLHEMLHAGAWEVLDEQWVDTFAKDAAAILYEKFGYRET